MTHSTDFVPGYCFYQGDLFRLASLHGKVTAMFLLDLEPVQQN